MAVPKKYKKKKTAPQIVEAQQPVNQIHKKPVSKLLLASIIAIFSFLLYANTLGHNYTVDDVTVITSNKIVQKGVDGIGEIFSTPYRKGYWDRNENMYRPLSVVMFALEWEMAPNKPWLGHLMNVLLYSLTGFLIFYALAGLLNNYKNHLAIAFASAMLFAAHPIHTEVVANIKSRDEILALLFCVLSGFSFVKYFDINKIGWLIISIFSFALALFSKENAITFLVIFPLTVYFFRNNSIKRNIIFSSLFIIPVVLYFAVRYSVLNHLGAHEQVMLINNSLAGAPGYAS
ncbi:MAG: glycosyltransferase family 39 protein, partial [Bacteroidia bacterium]